MSFLGASSAAASAVVRRPLRGAAACLVLAALTPASCAEQAAISAWQQAPKGAACTVRQQEEAEESTEVAFLQLDLGIDQAAVAELSAPFMAKKGGPAPPTLDLSFTEEDIKAITVPAFASAGPLSSRDSQASFILTQMRQETGAADAGTAGTAIIITMLVLLVLATLFLYRNVMITRDEVSQVQAYQSFVYRSYGDSMPVTASQPVGQYRDNFETAPRGLPPARRQAACC